MMQDFDIFNRVTPSTDGCNAKKAVLAEQARIENERSSGQVQWPRVIRNTQTHQAKPSTQTNNVTKCYLSIWNIT